MLGRESSQLLISGLIALMLAAASMPVIVVSAEVGPVSPSGLPSPTLA